ncbi:hemerythrin domain-containing protein [Propionibacteriaceae bacterium Y1685]
MADNEPQGWGDRLVEAHQMLRRIIAEAIGAAARAELGPTATLVEQMRTHCETTCAYLHGHHTTEDDAIFPHLITTNPDLAAAIERLRREHAVVAEQLQQLDADSERRQVEDVHQRLVELSTHLARHFAYEEAAIVEPLNALTRPAPWE